MEEKESGKQIDPNSDPQTRQEAKWVSRAKYNDHIHAMCSVCGYQEEVMKVVKLGKSSDDYVGVKWNYCPKCGCKMRV